MIYNNSIIAENFSQIYPHINSFILRNGDKESSRNGETFELLDFKTEITDPYKRLVGGYKRNINPFFLIAEAIWIFKGRRDVKFLEIFNSRMSDYSDDGIMFHAPYGFRLRQHGFISKNNDSTVIDQIKLVCKMISDNSNNRRIAASIWNPELDLNAKSKDVPCNDMLFFKVRKGKLRLTIANRSNDLHWGLPTNVYQFSFLSEMISLVTGYLLGGQVHNSQSLHIYKTLQDNLPFDMDKSYCGKPELDFYNFVDAKKIDFKFESFSIEDKLSELTSTLGEMLTFVEEGFNHESNHNIELDNFNQFEHTLKIKSKVLWFYFKLMLEYVYYKKSTDKEQARLSAIIHITKFAEMSDMEHTDVFVLCLNWFFSRLSLKRDEAQVFLKECIRKDFISLIGNL